MDDTYAYDAAGSRMMRTESGETVAYTLGTGDRLASWTGGAYTHDTAGNVTRIERIGRPTLDLAWNSQYQLASVSTNGVFAESYTYDALNRRVSTTTIEGTVRHVYDDSWQVIADLDEQGSVVVSYVWGEGIDNLLAVTVDGATYYALTDVQGTVWGYVDSQNNVVARWQYDAWGNVIAEDVSVPALARIRYRFQGREWSAATGLINFRMRWYDTETGRWLSKDPIGLSGGLNLYAFCGGNVLQHMDPLGLCERGWFEKVNDNFDDVYNEWGGKLGVEVADMFGVVGIASATATATSSALASIADAAAENQIRNGLLAGANCNGNIVHRILAAENGSRIATRTAIGKTSLGVATKTSGLVTGVATVWSFAVRAGFYIYSIFSVTAETLMGE